MASYILQSVKYLADYSNFRARYVCFRDPSRWRLTIFPRSFVNQFVNFFANFTYENRKSKFQGRHLRNRKIREKHLPLCQAVTFIYRNFLAKIKEFLHHKISLGGGRVTSSFWQLALLDVSKRKIKTRISPENQLMTN